jgi:hypothetical protein
MGMREFCVRERANVRNLGTGGGRWELGSWEEVVGAADCLVGGGKVER